MNCIDKYLKEELFALNRYIYEHPELGCAEFKSSEAHVELLKKHGFKTEYGYMGIQTGFRAEYTNGAGPTIAYLSEYDALPEVGHGCGHNIMGTLSTGAAIQLKENLGDTKGRIIVIGTPAEETDGAKVRYASHGAFDDVDVALISHPFYKNVKSGISFALKALRFTFTGKAAHAAAAPQNGINALDACISTFVNIGLLRQQIVPTARIHGIIKNGGTTANTIPDFACAEFYVRAASKSYLKELARKVCACAKAGAAAAGAGLEITEYETGNDNLLTNHTLQECLCRNLAKMGITDIEEAGEANGSTDVGDVSHVCPTIHPSFNIMAPGEQYSTHTAEFREATLRQPAKEALVKNVCALAMTGKEIMDDPQLLGKIKAEFKTAVEND